ncbi:MAG: antitoxin [Actinobacteria bacterium 69-20]|nr:ribbon-helix-helix protein, CopG family [Actinomycetota bacterium]OJV30937.1 MAG: antitoxin [Actinobacteria bacterium 69-20]
MIKTTVYLPDELKKRVEREARTRGVPEADVIRQAIDQSVSRERPRPRGGVFSGGEQIAEHVDEYLKGFGER